MSSLDIARGRGHISRLSRGACVAGNRRVLPFPRPARIDHETGVSVPNIRSAKKDMRKARAAAVRNRAQRSTLRTALKKALTPAASAEERTNAVSLLDRAARKGLIHANKAARHKAQIANSGR